MELEHEFTVAAPVDRAWDVLLDLDRVVPCMPGAALTAYDGDTFNGTVKVKLGPVSMTFAGKGRFVERDEAERRVVVEAAGKDQRGGGTAKATVTATLRPAADPSATDVHVRTDLAVTGRVAQFGRGMISDVSGRLVGQFTDCLQGRLAGPVSAEAGGAAAGTAGAGAGAASSGGAASGGAGAAEAGSSGAGPGGAAAAGAGRSGAGPAAGAGPSGAGPAAGAGRSGAGPAAAGGPAGAGSGAAGGGREGTGAGGRDEQPAGAAGSDAGAVAGGRINGRGGAVPETPFHGTTPVERAWTAAGETTVVRDEPPVEVEPVDLLAVTGISAAARRAVPYALAFLAGTAVGAVLVRWLGD